MTFAVHVPEWLLWGLGVVGVVVVLGFAILGVTFYWYFLRHGSGGWW